MSDFSIQLITVELIIPHAQSLKDKRQVVRSLKDRLRKRFNLAIAEVAYQDKWQRVLLAITMVGPDRQPLLSDADRVRNLIEESPDAQVTDYHQQWL